MDVGRFVADTLSGEKLSEKASAKRQALVQKLSIYLPDTFPPYLDMTATQATGLVSNEPPVDRSEYVGADQQPVEEEEYEEFPPPTPPPQPRVDTPIPRISFSDLRTTSPKSGPLDRIDRRRFLGVMFRQYLVGISEQRLLFYDKERDVKPAFVQDIAGYQARAAPTIIKDQKKRGSCFEVICPGQKTTQLIARTVKDMEQWVAAINKVGRAIAMPNDSPALRRRQLPSIPDSDTSETYDDIDGLHSAVDQRPKPTPAPVPVATVTVEVTAEEEEEIYHDISIVSGDDSDRESIYDDVGSYPISVYYNMGKETTLPLPKQIKEVNHEPPPLPHSNSSRIDEAEEIYDDIPAHNETPPLPLRPLKEVNREPSPLPKPLPPEEEEAEEMYDDISTNKETNSVKKPVTEVRQVSPQFPKPLPPEEEEAEEMYDDISANKETHSLKKTLKDVRQESPQLPKPNPPKEEEVEEMYDDISANKETLPQTIKKQMSRESTGNNIQGLIGKLNLEATLGRKNPKVVPGYCHKLLTNNKLNEPVHSPLPNTQFTFRPHLATKPNMTKK